MKQIVTTFRLEQDLSEKLRERAKKDRRSMNTVMVIALEEYLKN